MFGLSALRTARSTTSGEVRAWDRQRLLAILAGVAVVAVVLLGGLVYAVYLVISGIGDDETSGVADGVTADPNTSSVAQGRTHRDEIASAPMLDVPDDAMYPAQSVEKSAPAIEIPSGTQPGPAMVMTGFPHTAEGAIGQLAQIDVAVLQQMSTHTAHEVYRTWALPGGVGAERWPITASVEAFLSAADMGEVKDADSEVTITPAAALVKGTDGPDWVTACVLFKVSAVYRQESQVAFGHCERMQWVGGRWMIAPGTPPAPAPSTWPGTELAAEAGWRDWDTTDDAFDEGADGGEPS